MYPEIAYFKYDSDFKPEIKVEVYKDGQLKKPLDLKYFEGATEADSYWISTEPSSS